MKAVAQIDRDWFLRKLEENGQSVRGLAKHLDLDPSAVSRMFSGQRRMRMDEATAIANFLHAPVHEVLKHAGVAIDLDGQPTRVMLAATINNNGQVERLRDPRPLPQAIIERASAALHRRGNGRVLAAQVRALDGPLSIMDDAVVLFEPTDKVEPAAIGTLSICRSHDGEQILAKVERARKTGEARIVKVGGKVVEFDLHTATPVIAIIP